MRTLLWKEWHEQSWKIGFGCIVLCSLAVIGLRSRIIADEAMAQTVCFIGLTLLPVLTSTGLIPAERGEGTMEAMLALPISARSIMVVKTVSGLTSCAVPLLAAAGVSLAMTGQREITTAFTLEIFGRSILTSLSLFIWMQALTVHLPGEARAAMLALGVMVLWWMLSAAFIVAGLPGLPSVSPMAFVYQFMDPREANPSVLLAVVVQGVVAVVLWRWAAQRLAAGAAN